MNVLSIETTSERASIAYLKDCEVISQRVISERLNSRQTLLQSVRDIFAEAPGSLTDVDSIVCGTGPGSFTGIRLGMAFTAGIYSGMGKKVETCGIAANDSIAYACCSEGLNAGRKIITVIDSKTGYSFIREYSGHAEPLGEIQLLPDAEIKAKYEKDFFAGIFPEKFKSAPEDKKSIFPDAVYSAALFFRKPDMRRVLKPVYMMDFKPGGSR
ncbi:tRNA (adenosine(37)-N6)-threonylcarbamoyltransferase complex dimerization subunit type 1 TsaB [bacterium]|jgi:tRNA A37 threonylcarbamoyladenosine modification protein TsaB|nr:tRNA (adenosine(37)-N6)-threonylcarbamoyltransferase complex dimerization subunit type 1 TsaB [bacterium]